jgi:hypothetical protein
VSDTFDGEEGDRLSKVNQPHLIVRTETWYGCAYHSKHLPGTLASRLFKTIEERDRYVEEHLKHGPIKIVALVTVT